MRLRSVILSLVSVLTLMSCGNSSSDEKKPQVVRPDYSERNKNAMAHIVAYDVYGSFLGEANGVYVAPDIVLTPMSWIKGAQKAKLNPIGSKQTFNVFGFSAYNIDDDIVALRVERRVASDKLPPMITSGNMSSDGLHFLSVDNRKRVVKNAVEVDSLGVLSTPVVIGTPIYNEDGKLCGMVGRDNNLVSIATIGKILPRVNDVHESIYQMRLKSNTVYPSASSVSGFILHTSMGKISMRLLNETPEYKDNIIRLVTDHFYDSLLVHRVLENYLIQTGAADSRDAGPDSQVGWQGPGYTIPMHIVPGIFHKRGMVAASKLPQDHNSSNRSDGSQFYIVSGRTFSSKELDDIEKEYNKKFSPAQREAYTTVGGAPYLDGDYTVFAEVTSGMDVVDRIAAVPLNGDRPVKDIRIYKATLIRK
ncbi:MAG: peptidylprolyl isomerase [Bacteroidales bacterium]|nr:peptidylprolyl isomerase [Bacteroidales bacterium]